MRMRRLVPLAVVVSLAALTLSGCIATSTSTTGPTHSAKASSAPKGYAIPKAMPGEVARATFKADGEVNQVLVAPGLFNHIYAIYTGCQAKDKTHQIQWQVTIDDKPITTGSTTCDGTQ